ncbi:MAG: hypothetical protein RI918_2182 [Pseudomonadota bacterium]
MKRRDFLITSALATTANISMADLPKVQNLSDALRWLDKLDKAAKISMTGQWPVVTVLEHLSQSIEMSLDGFPQPKSAIFQNTAGAAAFAVFKWRGKMSHGLDEPIPGAAALTMQGDWKPAAQRLRTAITRFAQRLRTAITRFNGHTAALKPHFAYGALSKADFALAHAFHIANHQDEFVVS